MQEKIKISLPATVKELLIKDAKDFRVLKANGEANLNAFINTLIMNFYEEFAADDEALRASIGEALFSVPEKYRRDAFEGVVRAIAERDRVDSFSGASASLSFKPTARSESAILYIENVLIKNESISSFYRRMLVAYSKRTRTEREKLIYRGNFELLTSAMRKGVEVCISLDNGHIYSPVSVYSIAAAKDELFSYALLFDGRKNITVRLAKIKTVAHLPEKSSITDEAARTFDRQIAAGAQYPIGPNDNEPIVVQLTEKGRALFDKIYLYRPTPTAIDGDVYTFDCSANQALYYFERFGSEALILSPKKVGVYMRNYYYFALKKYRSIYGKE